MNETSVQANETSCDCNPVRSPIEDTFTFRQVRQILKLLQLDQELDTDIETRRFDAKIEVTAAQVKTLQRFVRDQDKKKSNKERLGLLHDVDSILNNYIVYVEEEQDFEFSDVAQDYTSKLGRYLPSSQDFFWGILFGASLGLIYLLRAGLPIWKWFLLLLALSSLWHWGHMYKKAVLKKHLALISSADIPHECFKEKTWFDAFFGANQKCSQYHEAMLVDPLWEVTPTMAVAETLTLFIVQPLEPFGKHLGKFFTSLLTELSWLSSLPVLVFVFCLILLILVMLFGYKVRLPFLLGSLEPQSRQVPGPQVHLLEQRIEELEQTIIEQRKEVSAVQHDREVRQVASLTTNASLSCETLTSGYQQSQQTEVTEVKIEESTETESLAEESKLKLLEKKFEELQLTIDQLKSDKTTESAQKVFEEAISEVSGKVTSEVSEEVTTEMSAVQDLTGGKTSDNEDSKSDNDLTGREESDQTNDDPSSGDFEWVNPNLAV